MSKKHRTTQLKERIAKLEQDCLAEYKQIQTLESEATAAYEKGSDPSAILEKIAKARSDHETMTKTLAHLDQRLIELSGEENAEARQRLQAEMDSAKSKILDDLNSHVSGLGKRVEKLLPEAERDALERTVRDRIEEVVSAAVTQQYSNRYAEEVPGLVKSAPRRYKSGAVDDRPDAIARQYPE
jgi:vacuolar-type H+-ATPase subunit I/STV1